MCPRSCMSRTSKARHPATSPSPTYGVSYPHCSLWHLLRAACECCPRQPCGLGLDRRRSWPRSSGALKPARWETKIAWVRNKAGETKEDDEVGESMTYSLVSRVTMMRIGRRFIPPTQLELHMKLYKMVVNSVPTWGGDGHRR